MNDQEYLISLVKNKFFGTRPFLAKLTNKKIDEIAVHAVEHVFDSVPTVLSHIKTNDKGLVVDGNLEVFFEGTEKKKDLMGRIDVQVKGTTSKPKPSNRPTKAVDVEDIRKFESVFFGALYFVVFLNSDGSVKRIFYKQYLPFDIQKSLARLKKDAQKTIQETFIPLPLDKDNLERLCKEFIDDRERQRKGAIFLFDTEDEARQFEAGAKRLALPKRVEDPGELASLGIWKNGGYKYSIAEDGSYQVFGRIEDVAAIGITKKVTVSSGKFSEEIDVQWGESGNGAFIRFGGFEIMPGEAKKLSYRPKGDAKTLLRDALLTKEIANTGELKIGEFAISSIEQLKIDSKALEDKISLLATVCDLIDLLKIKKNIYPYDLCENDAWQIDRLIDAFLKGKHVPVLMAEQEELVNLNIDLEMGRIKVFANRKEDGLYQFNNPFGQEVICRIGALDSDAKELSAPLPAFFMLSCDDYNRALNLDAPQLESNLNQTPICGGNSDVANAKLLEMLSAYDQGAICADVLLECCLLVANALVNLEPDSQIAWINRAQVLLRGDKLRDEDKKEIRKILMAPDGPWERVGACIVLGDVDMARFCLAEMDVAEREAFLSYPIAFFLDQ